MLGRPLQGIGLASVGAAQGPVPLLRRQGTARLELELGSQPLEALPATEVGVLPSQERFSPLRVDYSHPGHATPCLTLGLFMSP